MFSFKRIPRRALILFGTVLTALAICTFAIGEAKKDPLLERMEELTARYVKLFNQLPDCTTGSTRRFVAANDPTYNRFYNDFIAFKGVIEKESFLRSSLPSDDPKITVFGPVIGVYSNLQRALLTNYFMQAHRDPANIDKYYPDAMDMLNLKISTKVGTALLDNADYGLRDAIRHVDDGHGTHFMVEVFLTPTMIIDAEIMALQFPGNKIDYAKLVLASMLRQTIVNRWSLNRMTMMAISQIGYEKYYELISGCAKDLISYRMKGIKITDGPLYQSLKQEDRFDDFRAALPKVAGAMNGHPLLDQKLVSRAVREFLANSSVLQEHFSVMQYDTKKIDSEIDTVHAPGVLAVEKASMEDDTEVEDTVGGKKVKRTMHSSTKQLVDEHVYPADNLNPDFLGRRLAEHAFEERKFFVAKAILDRLKDALDAQLVVANKQRFVEAEDDYKKRMKEVDDEIDQQQKKDLDVPGVNPSSPQPDADEDRIQSITDSSPEPVVNSDIVQQDEVSAHSVVIAEATPSATPEVCPTDTPAPTPDPQIKADSDLLKKQQASQKKVLAYLSADQNSGKDAFARALKIVNRISDGIRPNWMNDQTKALSAVIADATSVEKWHQNNRDVRLKEFSERLEKPAQEGVLALQNMEKIARFIGNYMRERCVDKRIQARSDMEYCAKWKKSDAENGKNVVGGFWSGIGEIQTRLSWQKYNSIATSTDANLSAETKNFVALNKIQKAIYPITPDEASMLFGMKIQRGSSLPDSSERDYIKAFNKSKVAKKFIKQYFAKVSEQFETQTKALVKLGMIKEVTAENTLLPGVMVSVAAEINKRFEDAVMTPPWSRSNASPLLGDGPAIYKTFKPMMLPAVDNTYVRKSEAVLAAQACYQQQQAALKKENSQAAGEGALDVDRADADIDPNDYQATPEKQQAELGAFRNALAMIGVYPAVFQTSKGVVRASNGKNWLVPALKTPGKPMDEMLSYANTIDKLDDQMPGLKPNELMAASIWDQQLMAEMKKSSVMTEMPILGAEVRDTNTTDENNTFLSSLRDTYRDQPLSGVGFQNIVGKFTLKALERDNGKIEKFCSVDVNKRIDNSAFELMYQSSSALREALMQGNARLKRYDKELKKDTRTWSERAIDNVNTGLLWAAVFIGVVLMLSGIGALPGSWMTAMGLGGAAAGGTAAAGATFGSGAWVASFIWTNLTTNYGAMFIAGLCYTSFASYTFFYEQPRQLHRLGQVANSQFGIMGNPTVSRADLIARRQELHFNQLFTVFGIALDVTFFKAFTIPEVKRALGITGEKAVLNLTEGNPTLRNMILRESRQQLIEKHGFMKGTLKYLENYKPWLKMKRANVLNPKLVTEAAIEASGSYAISKAVPSVRALKQSHVEHLNWALDQADDLVKRYGAVVEYLEGNATVRAQMKQVWKNIKATFNPKVRKYGVRLAEDERTIAAMRAERLWNEYNTMLEVVQREEKAVATLTKLEEMTGAANQGLPETFHYFDGKNMDFLMGEKAHFDFMKKKLKKGDFAEATRQIYKDLGYLMQDYKSLTAVTVSMLLKNGTQIFGQETSDIAIVGKRKAGELNLKTGEWEAFPDKEMNPYMSDYVEYQVLPYSVAQDFAKRAAAEDLKNGTAGQVKFFYDVFLIGPTSWKGTKLAQNKNLLKNVAYRVKHIFPTVEQQESAKQINDLLEQLKKAAEEAQKNAG